MRPEDHVVFFTACGFFIGLTFSTINIEEAFGVLISTCLIIFMFHVFTHIVTMNFVDAKKISRQIFNKHDYEKTSSDIINDLVICKKKTDTILEKPNKEKGELKKNESRERRKNVKGAT